MTEAVIDFGKPRIHISAQPADLPVDVLVCFSDLPVKVLTRKTSFPIEMFVRCCRCPVEMLPRDEVFTDRFSNSFRCGLRLLFGKAASLAHFCKPQRVENQACHARNLCLNQLKAN